MGNGLNSVSLLGNLAADPTIRFTAGGQAVMNMRLATSESYLDRDKVRKERVDFHSIVVWGPRAEGLSKILRKGTCIFVGGALRNSSYEKDGQKHYKTEIVAREVLLTGRGNGGSDDHSDAPAPEGAPEAARRPAPRQAAIKPASSGEVATDRELDGQWGNPEIRFDPRDWKGDSYKKQHFADAPSDYLLMLAEAFESMAATEQDEKKKGYKRKDAKLARGWAKRNEAKGGAAGGGDYSGDYGGSAPPDEGTDDLPF